jgi:hypothetical protein
MTQTVIQTRTPHIHAVRLAGTDESTGAERSKVVVWADYVSDTCPRCSEPVPARDEVPVTMNLRERGRIEDLDLHHWDTSGQVGCGEWLPLLIVTLDGDATPTEITDAAASLAAERQAQQDTLRTQRAAELHAQLDTAIQEAGGDEDRLAEIADGTDTRPGVCWEDGILSAWAYGPEGEDDIVTVTAAPRLAAHA